MIILKFIWILNRLLPVGSTRFRGEWPSPLPAMECACPLTSVYSEKGESAEVSLCLLCSRPPLTRYCELCSYQLGQKQQTALCCPWIGRTSNHCWLLGCWQSCGSNSQGSRRWDSLSWPGCSWEYVTWGPHVCTNQNLVPWHRRVNATWQGMPAALLCLPRPYQHPSHLKVIALRKFLNFFWWLQIKLKATRRPRRLFCFLRNIRPGMIWFSAKESRQGQKEKPSLYLAQGPCIICDENSSITKAFRDVPGTTLLSGSKLNVLRFAPGGTWAISAFGLEVLPQVRWSVWHLV